MHDHRLETDEGQGQLFDPDHVGDEDLDQTLADAGLVNEATTGFVVLLDREGNWRASSRLDLIKHVLVRREAETPDFVHGGEAIAADAAHRQVVIDVTNNVVQNVARTLPNMTVAALAAQARAAQDQLASQRIMDEVNNPGRKLITPR